MPTVRHFWGPRLEQDEITLTPVFQFTGVIDVMQLVTAAPNIEIKHDSVALTIEFDSIPAGEVPVIVVAEWAHLEIGPFFRPVPNPEITLEFPNVDSLVSLASPGGFRFMRFGIRNESAFEGETDVTTQSSGEYIL